MWVAELEHQDSVGGWVVADSYYSFQELQAWLFACEWGLDMLRLPGVFAPRRDAWVSPDGTMREGVAVSVQHEGGSFGVIRMGVRSMDDPWPGEDLGGQ